MAFIKGKKALWAAGIGGVVLGLVLAVTAEQGGHATSDEAFCTSCHSMQAHVADSPYYQQSAHRTTSTGVVADCGDCHIPNDLVPATWVHVSSGIHDIYMTLTQDVDNEEWWAQRRPVLTERARQWFRDTDSGTCRHCHEQRAIRPQSPAGQRMHEMAQENDMTCIECHTNLVHPSR